MRVARIIGYLQDCDLFEFMDLHSSEANTIILLHGFDHIIDKFLELPGADLIKR